MSTFSALFLSSKFRFVHPAEKHFPPSVINAQKASLISKHFSAAESPIFTAFFHGGKLVCHSESRLFSTFFRPVFRAFSALFFEHFPARFSHPLQALSDIVFRHFSKHFSPVLPLFFRPFHCCFCHNFRLFFTPFLTPFFHPFRRPFAAPFPPVCRPFSALFRHFSSLFFCPFCRRNPHFFALISHKNSPFFRLFHTKKIARFANVYRNFTIIFRIRIIFNKKLSGTVYNTRPILYNYNHNFRIYGGFFHA